MNWSIFLLGCWVALPFVATAVTAKVEQQRRLHRTATLGNVDPES